LLIGNIADSPAEGNAQNTKILFGIKKSAESA